MLRKMILLMGLLLICISAHSQTAQSDTVWVKEIGSEVKTVKFSPDGKFIYAAAIGRKPMKLNAETGEILMEYGAFKYEATEHFSALDISTDGKWLIGGEYGNNIYIIDTETGEVIKTLKTDYKEIQSNKFNTVTITPDKRYVIATNRFGLDPLVTMNAILIWDTKSGELIKSTNSKDAMKVMASPDNKNIAVSYYNESPTAIKIIQIGTWETSASLCCHSSLIQDIAFSPDGSLLASCGWGGEIKVWDISKANEPIILPDYNDITAIGFLNNNQIVCNGSIDYLKSYTKIWDIKEQKVLAMIPSSRPFSLDVNQNSKDVILANYKSLLLFNADKLIANIDNNEKDTFNLNVSPNPSNSLINISFTLQQSGNAKVEIVDINSNQISLLFNSFLENGNHNFQWQTHSIPSGIYFCRISTQINTKTFKIVLEK